MITIGIEVYSKYSRVPYQVFTNEYETYDTLFLYLFSKDFIDYLGECYIIKSETSYMIIRDLSSDHIILSLSIDDLVPEFNADYFRSLDLEITDDCLRSHVLLPTLKETFKINYSLIIIGHETFSADILYLSPPITLNRDLLI